MTTSTLFWRRTMPNEILLPGMLLATATSGAVLLASTLPDPIRIGATIASALTGFGTGAAFVYLALGRARIILMREYETAYAGSLRARIDQLHAENVRLEALAARDEKSPGGPP